MTTQKEITDFYDRRVFPSKTSHQAYSALVPNNVKGLKVGDFGCGQSLFMDSFRKAECDAIFLDISPNALRTINYGERINASLTDIPLGDEYMDIIYCIGVVHHIPETEKAISELLRVLRKGGRLHLGVYAERSFQATLRRMYDKTKSKIIKNILYSLGGVLIWLKNYKNGLGFGSMEQHQRIDDLFKTPLVRYLPVDFYLKVMERYRIKVHGIRRISSMNIITVEKIGSSGMTGS
jgi:ubiquinone/menaquinone biosynthesis C-methylase UbiE